MILLLISCDKKMNSKEFISNGIEVESKIKKERQDSIIAKYLKNGAWKHKLYSREWQEEIDKGLAKDSTIAYLWQQKAMPLFKQGKYEIGMKYLNNAVKYDRQYYQDYRAFVKCIFVKTYEDAITDFEDYKKRYGNSYIMDHTYNFYIGLSYLQLNEFQKAEEIFESEFDSIMKVKSKDYLHHLDLFYYGISKYEQKKYNEAIVIFDLALEIYPEFSEVQIFKSYCLHKIGKEKEADELYKIGEINGRKGNTVNEDNVIYERYPYQIRWY